MAHQTYAETAVLAAIMERDIDEADRLLADFYPNELRTFQDQILLVDARIRQAMKDQAARQSRR
jgi:hypothetical protein